MLRPARRIVSTEKAGAIFRIAAGARWWQFSSPPMKPHQPPRLIHAASEHDADLFYATRFFAPDAFLFLQNKRTTFALMSDLEIDRARATMAVDEVHSWSAVADRLPAKSRATADVVAAFLRSQKVTHATVPENFPLGLAEELKKRGIALRPVPAPFFAERLVKTDDELKAMCRAHRITEAGLARGFEVLKASKPSGRVLKWAGRTLTSELLRAEIESAVLRAGGVALGTIVAGGDQACDPHERGSGPLRPGELVILDVFPRATKSGYHGDMTRTVVRGRASEERRKLWQTVLDAQKMALREMKPGTHGGALQKRVKDFFTERGYPTEIRGGRHTGFFHGLGHGLGLEVHDPQRMSATKFAPGHVLTVEPGLYYPGLGGVRHEDVVAITATGHRMLSRFPHMLEL
jgi:Xaa-Pro aminopeptidase